MEEVKASVKEEAEVAQAMAYRLRELLWSVQMRVQALQWR